MDLRTHSDMLAKLDYFKTSGWAQRQLSGISQPWCNPASAQDIWETEERLGLSLPPSYRSFLEHTNGWYGLSLTVCRLLPCAEIEWFKTRNPEWIDSFLEYGDAEVQDADYYVYGAEQDPCSMRGAYLKSALQISAEGDGAVVLLNPEIIHDGEWEAWYFGNWIPGARRFRSFADLFRDQTHDLQHALRMTADL